MGLLDFWLLPLRLERPDDLPLVLALALALDTGGAGVVHACINQVSNRSDGAGSVPGVCANARMLG